MRALRRNREGGGVQALVLDDPRYSNGGRFDRPLSTRPREGGGLGGVWRRRRELRRARALADAELLQTVFTTPRTAWRAAEVTSSKNRLALASAIRRLVAASDVRK